MRLIPPEVERDALARFEGRDLLMETLQWREAEGRRKMVRTERWKYTHDPMDPVDELYDLAADPYERRNLAVDPACAPVVAELRTMLLEWSLATEDGERVPLPAAQFRSSR
jgi:arylsulfatase A-like enzyme